jgi:hypothetical protein
MWKHMAARNDISFFCNFCGQKISIHESRVGTTVECPGCRSYIPVPSREELDLGPAPVKRDLLPINTKKITVRIKSPLEGAPPHPPAPPTARPAASSNGGTPLRNRKWLVIPILAGLAIVGALAIFQRPQKTPSPGTVAKLPVIDNNAKSIPSPAKPEKRVESKAPPPAKSADTGTGIPVERTNLLANESLSGTGIAPTGWSCWFDGNHDPDNRICRSAENSWVFWWDGGIYQDATSGFSGGDTLVFGGYLHTPSTDALRNGTKHGVFQLEFYNGGTLISIHSASPTVSADSPNDTWFFSQGTATVPADATKVRVVVRCNDWASGDGVFRADDVFLSTH